jgi:hypothetical protein
LLRVRREDPMTRKIALAFLTFALACKIEKTGRDTYKVVAPTPQVKRAAEKLKAQTSTAAQKLENELKKVGDKAKSETRTVTTEAKEETRETAAKAAAKKKKSGD